jgi:MSHA pilin protein MshA
MSARPDIGPRSSAGFTLVELALATVVLGIVSAVAAPRFLELGSQTRSSRLDALATSIRAGAELTRAASLAATPPRLGAGARVVVDGATVRTHFGYPEASVEGIVAAIGLEPEAGGPDAVVLVTEGNSIRIDVAAAWSHARCSVTYTAATATSGPSISAPDSSGC